MQASRMKIELGIDLPVSALSHCCWTETRFVSISVLEHYSMSLRSDHDFIAFLSRSAILRETATIDSVELMQLALGIVAPPAM